MNLESVKTSVGGEQVGFATNGKVYFFVDKIQDGVETVTITLEKGSVFRLLSRRCKRRCGTLFTKAVSSSEGNTNRSVSRLNPPLALPRFGFQWKWFGRPWPNALKFNPADEASGD